MPIAKERISISDRLSAVAAWPVLLIFKLLDYPLSLVQRIVGVKGMPWIFCYPTWLFSGFLSLFRLV